MSFRVSLSSKQQGFDPKKILEAFKPVIQQVEAAG